ncbi:hypothetical protein WJX72_011587 [[Myrmecia] bisecta]|uniref:C3H1-type domain-containing protein n=1 Tax=[Myrmecia] bisecta TaxID=41462 RepID=A0AAW1PYA8_9CHLO
MQARQGGAGGGLSGVGAARPSGTQQVTLLYRKSKDGFRLARAGIRSTARTAASAASVQATPAGGSSAKLAKYMRKGATLTRLSSLGRTPVMSAASRTQRQSPLQALKSRLQRKQQKKGSSSVCLTFCRTGKCPGTKDGRCKLVHDPAKVAVCPRWLQGRCAEDACPLQHRRCPELMPVCTFFLQGLCSNGACSYLHVNLDPAAPVCEDFLNGYCAKGLHCSHKHLTARMVKELRQNKTFAAAGSGGGAKAGPAPPTENSLAAEGPGFSEAIGLDAGRRHSSMHLRPAFLRNLTPAKVA